MTSQTQATQATADRRPSLTSIADCGCIASMADGRNARETPVNGRLPRNLAEAPDLLTMDQAASATGLSVWSIKAFEKNDPTFPKRINPSFSRTRRFRKAELQRWVAGPDATPERTP